MFKIAVTGRFSSRRCWWAGNNYINPEWPPLNADSVAIGGHGVACQCSQSRIMSRGLQHYNTRHRLHGGQTWWRRWRQLNSSWRMERSVSGPCRLQNPTGSEWKGPQATRELSASSFRVKIRRITSKSKNATQTKDPGVYMLKLCTKLRRIRAKEELANADTKQIFIYFFA